MATRSRSTARPQSPLDQGELGPTLQATADESGSLEPEVYGEISLSRAISLILGLQNQVIRLERELEEVKEINKEARDWMGAVDQALTCIEARGETPHTPEDRKPPAVEATPRPLPKADPLPAPSAPLVAWANPTKAPPIFAQPMPVRAPPRVQTPPAPTPIRLQSPQVPQPVAPVATYQAPVKVDHPDAYTGKIGNKACQWLTRMLAWVRLNQRMFPTDQEVLLFLLMNMKDVAGAWAHPHLNQLGSHRALIQTVDKFRTEFLAAFGNPDATRAAERQITQLTQTGTCAEYITKFRTIAMDLDWNDAALRGQFARGLHWENAALVIDNALRKERASHPPKGRRLSSDPNFVPEEEQNRRRAKGLCIKCGKSGHKFAECRTGWKATPKEESVKKEAAKVGKESGPESGKD
ncbi:Retrotransposon gag protein [Rhizoctonia solani]|uniref:Retrotransposon gag protein n=1 Tax=Rhizoctonia solani TaxID=456999 RepID=A0A8H8P963_9AGAM|nr:Retrotransposon gag protein [Rhizoctonia solani]QRW26106.1 Retrotransposon gag protein [Rhizoctonia solani]